MSIAPDIAVGVDRRELVFGAIVPVSFGSTTTSSGRVTKTFGVANAGWGVLELTGSPRVAVIGPHAADFTVMMQPPARLGSATFDVVFSPSATGPRAATLAIASNDPDEAEFRIPVVGSGVPAVPGLPLAVGGTPGDGRVALTWSPPSPSAAAPPVTDYVVQFSGDGGTTWNTFADGTSTSTSAVVTGLKNGIGYVFRVAATSGAGQGGFSMGSSAVMPRGVPGMPTALTATAGDGHVELVWTAAAANGSPVTAYKILQAQRLAAGWGPWVASVQPAALGTRATVTGLVNGAGYVFHVAAVNAAGAGLNTRGVFVTPAAAPNAPTGVRATPLGGRVRLDWAAPTSTGGAPVTGYVVEFSTNGGLTWKRWSTEPKTPTLTLNSLDDGAVHLFRVAAKNRIGTGGFSAPSAPVDPAGHPFPRLPQGAANIDRDASRLFTTTSSGLQYRMLRRGTGDRPSATDSVTVKYHGWLDDGTVFDSTYDSADTTPEFSLSVVIRGWSEGVQLVREGGMIELSIPSRLGYGPLGSPNRIPPNATLHFLVELVDTRKTP